jgi:hypothetical protein
MHRSVKRRSTTLAAVGAILFATFAFTGRAGEAQAAGHRAGCDRGPSNARVMKGHNGVDPNSVTVAEAKRADAQLQARVQRLVSTGVLGRGGAPTRPTTITVPVHVHVITADDGTGGVTQQQITAQIRVLNNSYAGRTARGAAHTPFTFQLASVDVTRNSRWYDWQLKSNGTETSDAIKAKKALHVGGWGDLNVYIAALGGGLLGYASFPQDGVLALDGLVLLNDSLPGGSAAPYNEGDTATHEIGHWLGLFHTFENGCTFPGDSVDDTPYQFDGDNIFFCDESDDTCPQPGTDPVHNFMSYGDDPCLDMFSSGQSERMVQTWFAYRA